MIVEFKLTEPNDRNGLKGQNNILAWLTPGRRYAVQALTAGTNTGTEFLVEPDAGGLGWWRSGNFTMIDSSLPASWRARLGSDGHFTLGPAAWLEVGYWEKYWDDDPEALLTYNSHRQSLPTASSGI